MTCAVYSIPFYFCKGSSANTDNVRRIIAPRFQLSGKTFFIYTDAMPSCIQQLSIYRGQRGKEDAICSDTYLNEI